MTVSRRSRGGVIAEWSTSRDFGFESRQVIVEHNRGFGTDYTTAYHPWGGGSISWEHDGEKITLPGRWTTGDHLLCGQGWLLGELGIFYLEIQRQR